MPQPAIRRAWNASADAELVARIAAGDHGAPVEALYDTYATRLLGLGLRLLKDHGMAEEMVQETFVRLWRSASRYDPDRASVRTFLYTIARRVAIDLLRRSSSRPLPSIDPQGEGGEAAVAADVSDQAYDRLALALDLQAALESLTPDHSEVIRLAYMGDLSQQQIAERLGVPLGTVKSRTYHALRELRAHLEEAEAVA